MHAHIGPTRVGRYEIKGLIAQGGMGDLYLARDPNTSRFVVLKLLNASLDSSELRGRFEREARALASLNHPSIVHIYDYGDFQGSPFIVMEYVRGETLAEKIKRQAPLTVGQKLTLMTELCAGLAHAHQAGIIHRDVKPANLMVTLDGRLKILDFGIARVADSNLTRVGTALTLVNMQVGTPGYMSPEQVQGTEIDHRTDVFAAGAVCYELLAYREAFPGTSTREVERKVMRTQPAPLAALLPTLDPGIGAIVTRALTKDRKKRYQNIAELRDALEQYRAKLETSDAPPLSPLQSNARVASHGSRPEAAYQRALVLYQDGAHDAARRFAIEALAEDANHHDARALLARLEPKAKGIVPAQPRTPTPAPTEHVEKESSTELVSPTDATVFIPRANLPAPSSTEETIFIPRTDRSARVSPKDPVVPSSRAKAPASSFWTRLEPLLAKAPAIQKQLRQRWASLRLPQKSHDRASAGMLWKQYKRSAVMVVGLVALAAGTVLLAMGLTGRIGSSGQVLTITKPVGGTIVSAGITCGTRGSNCSTTIDTGDGVELVAEADQGFAFGGFTGDCAPTGRTAMTASRTCGALFTPIGTSPPALTWTLTITRPEGGTILAAGDIQCGSFAAACTAELPNGVPLTLHATPDTGYTFLAFTGDCAPSGNTSMTGPRTCGATFAPSTAALPAPRPRFQQPLRSLNLRQQ